jgi:L-malate glycosyltransferase
MPEYLRVGIICHSSVGGSAKVATELAQELAERGHTVHVFSRSIPFSLPFSLTNLTIHSLLAESEATEHPARLYTNWTEKEQEDFISLLLKIILDENAGLDVLHFHYAVPFAFFAEEVERRLGSRCPKLIGTLHGTDVTTFGYDRIVGQALVHTLNRMETLTTVSNYYAELATDVFRLATKPTVISNFLNLARFMRSETGADRVISFADSYRYRRPVLVHVSNFRAIKNTAALAEIFIRLRSQVEAELWLVGDGPEMARTKAILETSPFREDVRYWGLQTDVSSILRQADMFVMTSQFENFSLALLEAMACGLPALCAAVGGLPEVVEHGRSGFLFPFDDLECAVNLGVTLLCDSELRQQMSRGAILRAQQFMPEVIIAQYEDLYHKALMLNNPVQRAVSLT